MSSNGQMNHGNRLKVEETFSIYKQIIGNKFKAQHFLAQQRSKNIITNFKHYEKHWNA